MSMVFLANVPSIAYDGGVAFYTPHEHVVVDYPSLDQPSYTVMSCESYRTIRRINDFATAMDTAARFLKRAEPA